MILLSYAITRLIDIQGQDITFQLPGFLVTFQINLQTLTALLLACLTAAGIEWIIRDHPAKVGHRTIEHWLLPALTAWVIGIPLFQLPLGTLWWAGFLLGGTMLMLVLIAEYIAVDAGDTRQPLASAGLTIVSYALFLILAVSLRFSGQRLFLILPSLVLATALVSLRTLHLRLHGQWNFIEAGVIAMVIGELAAAFHYWPLTPTAYGLVLLAPAYSLTSLIGNLKEGASLRQALLEPGIILVLIWAAAAWIK